MTPASPKPSMRAKSIAVTGADGMLGTELVKQLRRMEGVRLFPLTIKDVDITDLIAVRDRLRALRPDILIHTAAFTQVDTAEKEPLTAFMVNAEGTKNLAFFCRDLGIEMVHISTDYVFDGEKGKPYVEKDRTCPINTYGRTKELAEQYVQGLLDRYKIIRTSWLNGLGGPYPRNFIETILRIAKQKNSLSVVDDQIGCPTFTFDLARCLILLLETPESGIFHITNSECCSWHELASEIIRVSGLAGVEVNPIKTSQFRSLARRPKFSVLRNKRLEEMGFDPLPTWREGLREYFRRRRLREKAMLTPPPLDQESLV